MECNAEISLTLAGVSYTKLEGNFCCRANAPAYQNFQQNFEALRL